MRSSTLLLCVLSVWHSALSAQESFFPIWGDEAVARGYTLPKPYGLSISYMDLNNPVRVESINLSGHPVLDAVNVDADSATFKGSNVTLRGDVWIFPFLNVYGILGYTTGESKAQLNGVSCDANKIEGGIFNPNKALCNLINGLGGVAEGSTFALDMDGGTYGVGTTLAGGVGNWFGLIDMNYTYTDITAIEGSIKTFVVAPRVGYRWEYDGGRELRIFGGGMYQDVQQYLAGNLTDLGLSSELNSVIEGAAPDGRFEVTQRADHKWNTVVGFQYAFNHDWDVLMEAGVGNRTSMFVALGRRF